MTVNSILLTSMPRGSYVELHKNGAMDKLMHTGIHGVEKTLNTIGDWFGADFDYYVKVNISTIVDVIDAIGGIDVHNDIEFNSWIYQDIHYPVGDLYLDSIHALFFSRECKAEMQKKHAKRFARKKKI